MAYFSADARGFAGEVHRPRNPPAESPPTAPYSKAQSRFDGGCVFQGSRSLCPTRRPASNAATDLAARGPLTPLRSHVKTFQCPLRSRESGKRARVSVTCRSPHPNKASWSLSFCRPRVCSCGMGGRLRRPDIVPIRSLLSWSRDAASRDLFLASPQR